MSTNKEDEDFWNSSEKRSFCFENEVDQLFRVSKDSAEELWVDMSDLSLPENSFESTNDDRQTARPLLSIISDKTLSCILAADRSQNVHPEIAVAQPNTTLKKILLGQPYSLEQYKSIASKTALLDAAILSGDGNAILIIILFLTKTLKWSLVKRLLMERPDAVNIYLHYLFIRLQTNDITDILTMLGHTLIAAMKNLHIIIRNTRDPKKLLQKLHNCYKTHFAMLPDCKEATFLKSYIKLLEWQMAIKEISDNEELPFNSSILESLQYAFKHHGNAPDNSIMSPTMLSRDHDISAKQHEKVALQVKAACGEWDHVDRLLLTKGILGNKKLQTHLYIEDILKVLYKNNASHAVLEKYLKFVDNLEKRLELAMKLSCHTIVIDIFVQQGNRTMLMDYKTKLQPQSGEYFYAESTLRLPHVKWKN